MSLDRAQQPTDDRDRAPEATPAATASFGGSDAAIAAMHQDAGNAAVAGAFGGGLDLAAAEAFNRAHIVDVVRFDRATHGRFARGDGQIDAARLAAWQAQQPGLDPDGKVTENTCLVAEGKPPIPKAHKAYEGTPRIDILHPHGGTFPAGYPMPLTISISGPPGAVTVSIIDTITGRPREEVVTIGPSGNAVLDLRLDLPFFSATGEVQVSAMIGGEAREERAPFSLATSNLPPPSRALIGPEPPLPEPGPDRKDIDQAAAETYNRDHVPEVVRFDRATHGYFAKTNGELDALAIAEWQAEQHDLDPPLAVTGTVDPRTVERVEAGAFHGLKPGRDPDRPGQGEHGPIDFDQIVPDEGQTVVPMMAIGGIGQTRRHVDVQVDWALTDADTRLSLGRGSAMAYAEPDGRIEAFANLDYECPQPTTGILELAFVTPYGSTELIKRLVSVPKYLRTGSVDTEMD